MSTSTSKTAKAKSTPATAAPKTKAAPKKAEPVVEEVEEVKKERKRREVTKESVDQSFTDLEERVNAEIERIRSVDDKKVKGVKFLRSINKALKMLHADTKRVTKLKKNKNKDGTKKANISGFLKPVHISAELAEFTGWDVNGTYSRVDVTKFICEYVKEKELNKESDKRVILCNEPLAKLLNYDAKTAPIDPKTELPQEMNYYRLQQYLKNHFIKIETPKETTEVAAAPKGKAKAKTEKTVATSSSTPAAKPKAPAKSSSTAKPKAPAKGKAKPEPTPAPTPADDEEEVEDEEVEDEDE